jgi:hypothetical protein
VQNKICLHRGCNKQPSFNVAGVSKAIYCSHHKEDCMVNVRNKTCKSFLCDTQVGGKYRGYCLFCFINLFPDEKVCRNYKTKEKAVVDFVSEHFPNVTWRRDKQVQDGCSKRRPDMLLDLGEHVLIIEIDENQHIDYDCSCENKRIMEISQDINHRKCVFIRFNPDDYLTSDKKITSCWGVNKNGILVVKKSKELEWHNRLRVLKETISYWIEHQSSKLVEVIELFFDQQ